MPRDKVKKIKNLLGNIQKKDKSIKHTIKNIFIVGELSKDILDIFNDR